MGEPTEAQVAGEVVGLADLAETLERMGQGLAEALGEAAGERSAQALASCVAGIEEVSAALRSMAQLYDPGRASELARESQDFRSLAETISRSIRALADANQQITARLGEQVSELTGLAELPTGQAVGPRLQSSVAKVRGVAREMQQNLRAISDQVDRANQGISELERELHEARQKAALDSLTGLHSRAALDEHLDLTVREGTANGPWSVLLIDIDHFKRVNDTHGHLVGDSLLYHVARVLERSLRGKGSGDFLARYGGEEFAAVLAGADLAAAVHVAERLRTGVAAARWHPRHEITDVVIQVTVSVGVGEYRTGDTVAMVLERADRALYQAKRDGRNRVVAVEP